MITNEKGFFVFLTFDSAHDWNALGLLANPELDRRGLTRLQAVLESGCACVVVERHYIDKDYRDTFSHFHSKRFSTPSSRCLRLHFFSRPVTEDEVAATPDKLNGDYLGYSVIRPTKPNCIGRTLLSQSLRLEKSAHVSYCEEKVLLMGSAFSVRGFPFISQDADATVCAQSALWMLLRYYSNRYPWYSEILPFQITSLANHHANGNRVYPSSGLFSWQLAEALRLQRFSPVVYSRNQYPHNFDHLLYTYVESGLPLLVTVPNHVVTGYGHSSDYTRPWPPLESSAQHVYTSYFNCAYVVSDDNFYPYQLLRSHGREMPQDSHFNWSAVEEFIVPLPEKVFLAAEQAQAVIEVLLLKLQAGIATQSPSLAARKLVFRLFLTSSRAFKRRLQERGMGHPVVAQVYRNLPMPHFIWVCEIADFAEYKSEKKVLGEVIWDATRNAHEPNGWIALHYPEKLVVDLGPATNVQQSPQTIKEFTLGPIESYSLFSSNLHSL
jgi:hypothetical protein